MVPADEIGLLPDQNDAEVVQREPGVLMEKNEARRRPYRAYSWRGAESEQRDTERTADGIDGDRPRLRARRAAGCLVANIELAKVVTPDADANTIWRELSSFAH